MPALAARMSILPQRSTVARASDSRSARTVTSVGERKRVAAVGVELGGARRGGVAVDIGEHDVCALRAEHAGDPSADPAGRAGHDRHLSVESLHPGWGSACQPAPMCTVGSVVVAASALILKIGDL